MCGRGPRWRAGGRGRPSPAGPRWRTRGPPARARPLRRRRSRWSCTCRPGSSRPPDGHWPPPDASASATARFEARSRALTASSHCQRMPASPRAATRTTAAVRAAGAGCRRHQRQASLPERDRSRRRSARRRGTAAGPRPPRWPSHSASPAPSASISARSSRRRAAGRGPAATAAPARRS